MTETVGSNVARSTAGEFAGVIKRLDPNMLAALMLTIVLNGMFFYVYLKIAADKHVEFMAALTSCPSYNPPAQAR